MKGRTVVLWFFLKVEIYRIVQIRKQEKIKKQVRSERKRTCERENIQKKKKKGSNLNLFPNCRSSSLLSPSLCVVFQLNLFLVVGVVRDVDDLVPCFHPQLQSSPKYVRSLAPNRHSRKRILPFLHRQFPGFLLLRLLVRINRGCNALSIG